MFEVSDELNKNLIEWSEGNEYLYSLLYLSWQHGIRTDACCGGHPNHKDNDPYIMFIIDEKNLPYFESMIAAIEDIPDVSCDVNYRNNPNIGEDSKLVFTVHCMMHNRMETFYRLAEAIQNKKEIKTDKGKKFNKDLINLLHTDKSLIEEEMNNGVTVSSTFTTFTEEREEYLNSKKRKLRFLRQILTKTNSKYDINQEEIDEKPQIRYK